jgi:hypothetical protein
MVCGRSGHFRLLGYEWHLWFQWYVWNKWSYGCRNIWILWNFRH